MKILRLYGVFLFGQHVFQHDHKTKRPETFGSVRKRETDSKNLATLLYESCNNSLSIIGCSIFQAD